MCGDIFLLFGEVWPKRRSEEAHRLAAAERNSQRKKNSRPGKDLFELAHEKGAS
jgi:hypothetical protein